jgi:glyoxylase-like metal-dependent hydrolase (beta-lactamase superfamily II)
MRTSIIIALVTLVLWPASGIAQQPPGEPRLTQVREGLYMLSWRGGNIGVSVGEDGVILIDDQYAPQAPGILAAIRTISDAPLRFVMNTHWHGDHTGGNESMAGAGALIIAHDNVRRRLAEGMLLREIPPAAGDALPVVTFDNTVTLHFNGTEVHAFHVEPAHTDGDSVVHFRDLDVIHAGDLYFNGFYPFIDTQSGGSMAGVVAAVDRMLPLCGPETVVIPGHGPLADCAALAAYGEMLGTIHTRVATMIADGATEDEVVAAGPTAEYDAEWGNGFLGVERFVRSVYRDLTSR